MQQKTSRNRRPWPLIAAAGAMAGAGALALANRRRAKQAVRENPPIGEFVRVGGADIHYLERGSGPPILLVHGNGVMVQDWLISGLVDELAKTNRVVAFDRPGFGHSSRPRGTRWTPERQADLVAELMTALDIDRPLVVGQSYGALLTVALAVRHGERIRGAVLVGGFFYPEPRADVMLVSGSAMPIWGDVLNHTLMPLMGEALQERINHKIFDPAPIPEAWRRDFSWAMALRPSRVRAGAADAVHMIPAARRLAPSYPDIMLPVTILAGTGDRLVSTELHSERLHGDLPKSRLILLPGIGHMAHHSARREVAAAIRTA